jgi:hypothetical protein
MSANRSELQQMAHPYPCPCGCGRFFADGNGAMMHAINSTDAEHEAVRTRATAYERLSDRLEVE